MHHQLRPHVDFSRSRIVHNQTSKANTPSAPPPQGADGTVRIHDVPTSQLLDWLSFSDPCVSIGLKGEFLATAHEGRNYISLWSDKSYYGTVHGERPARPYAMEGQESEHDKEESPATHSPPPPILASEDGPVVPKANGMVTMSGLPDGMWKR